MVSKNNLHQLHKGKVVILSIFLLLMETVFVFSQTMPKRDLSEVIEMIAQALQPDDIKLEAEALQLYDIKLEAAKSNTNKRKPRKVEKFDLNGPFVYKTPLGDRRKLYPSCSGGPSLDRDTGTITGSDEQFSFYMQRGNKKKVLFMFGGGGACWDGLTCIGSPILDMPTYFQDVTSSEEYNYDLQGIVDKKKANPYNDYTKVLIPYCTGDLHLGSRDKEYSFGDINWTIKHRGFDNFLSILSFLQNKSTGFKFDFEKMKHLSVIGYSAGGYGALLALPYLTYHMPLAKVNVVSDSAIGAITSSFYKTALWNPKDQESTSWGIENNIPSWISIDEDFFDNFVKDSNEFIPAFVGKLCDTWPQLNAAMITSNLDETQIFFYLLMRLKESPFITVEEAAVEWYNIMVTGLDSLQEKSNYKSYISDGSDHGFLFYSSYYDVITDGVAVNEWLFYMLKNKTRLWLTVDAGSPFKE